MERKDWPKLLSPEVITAKLKKFNEDYDYEELARDVPKEQHFAILYPHVIKSFDVVPDKLK